MKKFFLIVPVFTAAVLFSACSSSINSKMAESTPTPVVAESSMVTPTPGMETDSTIVKGVMVGGALMTPDKDIVANALNAKNVTTLVAAAKAADLVTILQGPGPFTVFAPTNSAFEKLPAGTVTTLLKPENKMKLQSVLKYHVVTGTYPAAMLKDGMKLKTVQGEELMITMKDGKVLVNGAAMVETADVISINGITHVIDTVLMPKN